MLVKTLVQYFKNAISQHITYKCSAVIVVSTKNTITNDELLDFHKQCVK